MKFAAATTKRAGNPDWVDPTPTAYPASFSFGYGSALVAAHAGLALPLLTSAAAPADEPCEIDEAQAAGLFAACVLLVDFTEEVKEPPPEEE